MRCESLLSALWHGLLSCMMSLTMKRFLIAFLLISFAGLFVFGAYVTHGQHTGVACDCMATMLNGTRCADAEDHADILSAVSKTMLTQPFPSILFGLLALLV